jgi:hypothetical protein
LPDDSSAIHRACRRSGRNYRQLDRFQWLANEGLPVAGKGPNAIEALRPISRISTSGLTPGSEQAIIAALTINGDVMDLQELAERTKIPVRRLRHCVDEKLVPGLEIESGTNEVGRRRRFNEDVGFGLCCAATLVDAGIHRSLVRVFVGGLTKVKFPGTSKPVLVRFFELQAEGFAELGDSVNIRIIVAAPSKHDTGWVHPDTGAPFHKSYKPLTTIGLNLGAIGKKVFNW